MRRVDGNDAGEWGKSGSEASLSKGTQCLIVFRTELLHFFLYNYVYSELLLRDKTKNHPIITFSTVLFGILRYSRCHMRFSCHQIFAQKMRY